MSAPFASTNPAPFDLFGLPLELREIIYEHLEMPRKGKAIFWKNGESNFTDRSTRVQYDWRDAAKHWTEIIWYGSEYDMMDSLSEIRKCLQDAGLHDLLNQWPKHAPRVSRHSESWLVFLEDVEKLKTETVAMLWGNMLKHIRTTKVHLMIVLDVRGALQATKNLLSTNRQLANEVRTAIAKTVKHKIYLHEGHLHELDSHHFPISDALRNVRAAKIHCDSYYEVDVVKLRGNSDLVAHIKRVADVTRFMPFLTTLTFTMEVVSGSHGWGEIKDEVKSTLLNTTITGHERLKTLEVCFMGQASDDLWCLDEGWDMDIKLEKKISMAGGTRWVHKGTEEVWLPA